MPFRDGLLLLLPPPVLGAGDVAGGDVVLDVLLFASRVGGAGVL